MIECLHDKVAVRRLKPQESAGGILLTAATLDKRGKAGILCEVVSAGPGRVTRKDAFVPTTVKPGDLVYVPDWAGDTEAVDGICFVFEKEILAVAR